jgi:hypothetical protein
MNNFINIISASISAFIGAGIASTLLGYWLENKRLERIKNEESIESVSELLSEWVKRDYTGDNSNNARWRLQTLYWKRALRLDKKILDVLIPLFANPGGQISVSEVIVECRQILLNLKKPDFNANQLNKWPAIHKPRKSQSK